MRFWARPGYWAEKERTCLLTAARTAVLNLSRAICVDREDAFSAPARGSGENAEPPSTDQGRLNPQDIRDSGQDINRFNVMISGFRLAVEMVP